MYQVLYVPFKITILLRYDLHTIKVTLLRSVIQWILVYSQNCVTVSVSHFRTFHHHKINPVAFSSPLPPSPGNH